VRRLAPFLAFALALLLTAWAWMLTSSAYHAPQLYKNAYWPFTVELSVKDR